MQNYALPCQTNFPSSQRQLSFVFRTTMGENVLEYDGVLLDEDDDPYYEECSSSEDDFLEIPLNDRFFYKHWKK